MLCCHPEGHHAVELPLQRQSHLNYALIRRYNLSLSDWSRLCKPSTRAHSPKPETYRLQLIVESLRGGETWVAIELMEWGNSKSHCLHLGWQVNVSDGKYRPVASRDSSKRGPCPPAVLPTSSSLCIGSTILFACYNGAFHSLSNMNVQYMVFLLKRVHFRHTLSPCHYVQFAFCPDYANISHFHAQKIFILI